MFLYSYYIDVITMMSSGYCQLPKKLKEIAIPGILAVRILKIEIKMKNMRECTVAVA